MNPCLKCKKNFEVSDRDKAFYQKISPVFDGQKCLVDEPKLCPDCRNQRRLAFRNERSLYQNKSFLTENPLISYISPEKNYKVCTGSEWWGDSFDAMKYGRDFDFNRSFFEQFFELYVDVPMMNVLTWQSDNCDYCNCIDFSKDCYLTFGASNCERVHYSNLTDSSSDSLDLSGSKECELCYDLIDCIKCYKTFSSISCKNSHDLYFCYECNNCEECIGCHNLKQKKYCIFNEQLSKEDYETQKKELNLGKRENYGRLYNKFIQLIEEKAVHKASVLLNSDNCSGNNLTNSKNADFSFESDNMEDCKWTNFSMNCKDAYDIIASSKLGVEKTLEGMCIEGKNILSGFYIAGHNNVFYSMFVAFCDDVFGCVGLKHHKYCILNKQYSREEYEKLALRIVNHMKKTCEWGEFFDPKYSPFSYNETVANDYYPLFKERALELGFKWKEKEDKKIKEQSYRGGYDIKEVNNEIIKEILVCHKCGENYRIIQKELDFYRKMNLPIPENCPNCRYKLRMEKKRPYRLWNRECGKCRKSILSTYSPERRERIVCNQCYLEEVY